MPPVNEQMRSTRIIYRFMLRFHPPEQTASSTHNHHEQEAAEDHCDDLYRCHLIIFKRMDSSEK